MSAAAGKTADMVNPVLNLKANSIVAGLDEYFGTIKITRQTNIITKERVILLCISFSGIIFLFKSSY